MSLYCTCTESVSGKRLHQTGMSLIHLGAVFMQHKPRALPLSYFGPRLGRLYKVYISSRCVPLRLSQWLADGTEVDEDQDEQRQLLD